MGNILHLQRLTPTVSAADFNIAFASSVSSVCPASPGDQNQQFELD